MLDKWQNICIMENVNHEHTFGGTKNEQKEKTKMKRYLTISTRGKWEIVDTLEEAKKICDKKNKTQKYKWVVRELTEGKYECRLDIRYLCFREIDAPVVYDPYNLYEG